MVLRLEPRNLRDELHTHGWRPTWATVLVLAMQAARALAACHELGMLHRDVKPGNILLGEDGAAKVRQSCFAP